MIEKMPEFEQWKENQKNRSALRKLIDGVVDWFYEEAEAYKLGGREGVDADSVVPREVERIMASVSETIASELHRSLDFYLATSSEGRVSRIYLSGGTASVSSLAPTIANRVGVEVELMDPFKAITVDPKRFNLELINRVRPAAAVAVGLGLRGANDR